MALSKADHSSSRMPSGSPRRSRPHPINRIQADLLAERAGQVLDLSAAAGEPRVLPFPLPQTDSPNAIDLRD
jgi:hypothetical protein